MRLRMLEMREQTVIEKQVKLDNNWIKAEDVREILNRIKYEKYIDYEDLDVSDYPIINAFVNVEFITLVTTNFSYIYTLNRKKESELTAILDELNEYICGD